MSRTWRFAWLCLLALALPLQGWAAATMAHCGPSHERMHGASPSSPGHGQHAAAGHQQHTTIDAHAGHDRALAADADGGAMSGLAQYQCSACGVCCSAAALPATVPDLPASAATARPSAERGPVHPAYLTDGPERPPRTVLA